MRWHDPLHTLPDQSSAPPRPLFPCIGASGPTHHAREPPSRSHARAYPATAVSTSCNCLVGPHCRRHLPASARLHAPPASAGLRQAARLRAPPPASARPLASACLRWPLPGGPPPRVSNGLCPAACLRPAPQAADVRLLQPSKPEALRPRPYPERLLRTPRRTPTLAGLRHSRSSPLPPWPPLALPCHVRPSPTSSSPLLAGLPRGQHSPGRAAAIPRRIPTWLHLAEPPPTLAGPRRA